MLAPNLVREIDCDPTPWRNRFQKPSFSSIHTSTSNRSFQKSPLWRAILKRYVFGDCFQWIRVDVRPKWRKKISFFKQKWIRVDGALLAYVRYERMEHVKMTAQKTWWQSLAKSWSHTESCVCGSLRANILVFWYVFGCGRWQVEKGGRKWRFGFTLWLLMSNVSQVALQCDQTNRGHPDKILRQILKLGNHVENWTIKLRTLVLRASSKQVQNFGLGCSKQG